MYSKALNIICKSILVVPFLATSMASISAELEEIVVTAQKRSESLQEVPISIVAFSGDEIERLNISNTIDLVKNIPGIFLTRSIVLLIFSLSISSPEKATIEIGTSCNDSLLF